MPGPIQIYIDADACPVKDETYRVAGRYGLKVGVVSNSFMMVADTPLIERVIPRLVAQGLVAGAGGVMVLEGEWRGRVVAACRERDINVPDGYHERMPTVARIEEAMAVRPLASVPCNNDLLAENYIDDGKQLWLIDYEYSGNNDPCFELGNTCQEQQYDEPRIVELGDAVGAVAQVGIKKLLDISVDRVLSSLVGRKIEPLGDPR